MKLSSIAWFLASLATAALLVLAWHFIAEARLVSPVFLPSPEKTWRALVNGLRSGALADNIFETVYRMALGWVTASLIGIGLGALIGTSPRARALLGPMLEFMRPLPASAVIPVAIALLGLSDGMVLAIVAFGSLWPMLLATVHGFSSVEPALYEVSKILNMSRAETIFKIALPSSMPDILAGLRLGLTVSLILAVVGEMLASRSGLGQWILLSGRAFRSPDLFAGVVLLALVGLASGLLLMAIELRLLRWRHLRV